MERKNWTGRSLSKKANLSYNAIHYILCGKNKGVNLDVINSIANVLEISPFYLLDENYDESNIRNKKGNHFESRKIDVIRTNMPYNGELYREIMCIVEEVLKDKNNLTTQKVEYFTRYLYPQIQQMKLTEEDKNLKSYIKGVIDYALNIT